MAERNFDGIQFEAVRRVIDKNFNDAHDALEDAYYNFWKQGRAKAWKGFDKGATPAESKALFDKLHGLLFLERDVAFHAYNQKLAEKDRIPEEKYNVLKIDAVTSAVTTKSDFAAAKIADLKGEGIEIGVETAEAVGEVEP